MKPPDRARWELVEEVFQQVSEADVADRAAVFDRLCGGDDELRREVASLLESHEGAGDFLESSVHDAAAQCDANMGRIIGAFQLGEQVGAGGMGAVYRARRIDGVYEQEVAIKLIRDRFADRELTRRFKRERQLLASLQHPHIAQLIDGGVTDDGRPYLAMEFVRGRPITEYCDEHTLDIGRRLDLFDAVCTAVQHAHTSLIVHRDLKPANILVDDDGQPRLLDFGIASALDEGGAQADITATQQRRFSPQYASPEQVRGLPITTAVDVYSLGMILFELLSGRRAYRVTGHTPEQDTRAICDTTPPPPSRRLDAADDDGPDANKIAEMRALDAVRLRRRLRGDLDTIVMTALRKDPERRYASAEALRDDLRRYRKGRTIAARPDSLSYRTSTFVKRNRVPVAAGVAVFLTLVGGVIGIGWQASEATRGRAAAESALATSDTVGRFLRSILLAADPREGGKDISMREAIDRAADRIEEELGSSPEVESLVREAIGTTYRTLGEHAVAEIQLERSLELARSAFDKNDLRTARIAHELGILRLDQGRFEDALTLFESVIIVRTKVVGPRNQETLRARNVRSTILEHLERHDEAYAELRSIIDIREELLGATHPETLVSKNDLCSVLRYLGRNEEAVTLAIEVYEAQVETIGPDHPDTLISANDVGVLYKNLGQYQEASEWMRTAIDGLSAQFPAGSIDVVIPRINLADTLGKLGRYDEAIALGLATVADAEPTLGNNHYIVAVLHADLGIHYLATGDVPRALEHLEPAHAVLLDAFGPEHRFTLEADDALRRARESVGDNPTSKQPESAAGGSKGG